MKGAYYSATGNKFLVVDSRNISLSEEEKRLLVLKYVGESDGAIFVESGFMDYFNRDGLRAAFCGNGARTYVHFIHEKENSGSVEFSSHAGVISGLVEDVVSVKMPPPRFLGSFEEEKYRGEILVVGVPHLVMEGSTEAIDWGALLPLRHLYDSNVNIYSVIEAGNLRVRTFERGVERETGACGSGATSVAWVYSRKTGHNKVALQANGGLLTVTFRDGAAYLGGGVEKCSEELELQL
ncbi:diaminopimelate epimerase [Mesotoga sp. Brook.08.YT.4.2.5.1]|uniref:diaminopimelate epimerase n=1 Tax=unclassified Mesotoga TaxID=1184398 RepID=UPI000C17D764|nr:MULTISPECIES: diaminopimelate epimerase [unclassified Mesotoga]RAM58603.1 diaminopimelate epimerase [Mesotoga sp. SC_4PWL113PWK15]PNE18034.1 diaminopimelate epimerase [Mesotoga sp. Brook.08.YT.4.2.5.1]PVD17020.1 diaminopimelate epimerase [Mesotoga sp. Brook.08.105.5.1]RAO97037.1 diaminopimelate epimerase [Mesotoga sp. Brook.08.YT.4.2.5.4.]RDI93419.1 diaminopimelate epimerase [Mesotoga sp. Brook.08.YT.4.2.5.2.]